MGKTIEEKARAYDKALERAKELYSQHWVEWSDKDIESIFPELKESKDEQHRKWILEYLYDGMRMSDEQFKGQFKCAIDWLEKQELKSNPYSGVNFSYNGNIWGMCARDNGVDILFNKKLIRHINDEKQGEQKSTNKTEPKFKVGDKIKLAKEPKYPAREIISIGNDCYYFDSAVYLPFERQDEWELVEQKPAWSEEDEEYDGEDYGIDGLWHAINILERTLGKVSGYQTDDGILSHQCAITAVKKLYEQKSTNWSEEDEIKIKSIIAFLKSPSLCAMDGNKGIIDANIKYLKSLKDRVQPQNNIVTDKELAQAKKEAYNETLDKIEYHSGEPTFDDVIRQAANLAHLVLEELSVYRQRNNLDDIFDCEGEACAFLDLIDD